mmetsp:Transcript_23348/g.20263  ORF Transcript_23348/g.20263 Transcript_23348/m.20263 type:complete len:291 (-) Transcript_23348:2700-3572(-)
MSAEQVVATFEELITNPEKLKNGYTLLTDLINNVDQFAVTTCQVITTNELDSGFRKNVGYIMKGVLTDLWDHNNVLIQQRGDIKEALLNGIVLNVNDLKMIEVISLTIANLMMREGCKNWTQYLAELVGWLNTNKEDTTILNAGLECLCLIFSKSDNTVSLLVPDLMPIMYDIFTLPELTEGLREKTLKLLYLCIDSFSYAEGTDNMLIRQCFDSTYNEWISIFTSALQTSSRSNITIKRLILKILTKIFSELEMYSSKTLNVIIQPIWKFMNSNLSVYIWNSVYGIPLE